MTPYEQLLAEVYYNGTDAEDRTGTGTRSKFGAMLRFDLSEGFPLITTKKVHWPSVVHELLWFISGDTNNNTLEDNNVRIWREWQKDLGSLGDVYGHMWRYWPSTNYEKLVDIKVRTDKFWDYRRPKPEWLPKIDCDLNNEDMWAVDSERGKNTIYTVQTRNGFVGKISRPNWRNLKDWTRFCGFSKTVYGVGYLGNKVESNERVYNLWYNMLARCYNTEHPQYPFYGGAGVTVSPIWHSYEMFCKTIASVPFFHLLKTGSPHLDKDYFGSNVYSPSTCIFLQGRHNQALSVEKPGLDAMPAKAGHVKRREIFIDQIEWLINEIKTNPNSRRLVVNSWNPAELDNMALPPCHMMFQVYVRDNKLSLSMYQRSADLFLGVPFNIASYSLLAMMIANECGLELGEYVHFIGDAHIYHNHFEQVKEQLSRTPYDWPEVALPKGKKVLDMTYEDIQLMDYNSHPLIKGQVSV